jgi:hypothetical protein
VRQIKLVLDQVALLCDTFEMHQSAPERLNFKTLILIWDTGASAGLRPFWSDFIDYVKCEIDVRDVTKVNMVVGIGTLLHKFVDKMVIMFTCHVCLTIFHQWMSGCFLPRYTINFMVVILW